MPHVIVEIISRADGRPYHRRYKHNPYVPARRIHDLQFHKVVLIPHPGGLIVNVTGSFSQPTTHKSGAPLAPADIDHFSLHRNGTEIQTLPPNLTGPTVSWTDTTPLTGTDTYEAFTVTKDGFISDPSNDAIVTIATADPAAAITDLKATPNP